MASTDLARRGENCRAMRSVVASRLVRFIGRVDERTMLEIEQAIALILEVGISSSDSES